MQHDERREEVDDRDPHEHAEDAEVAQVERFAVCCGDRFEKQRGHPAEEDQRGGAANDSPVDGGVDLCAVAILAERVGERRADDEQEEGEDEIGRRPAVPFGVVERPVLTGSPHRPGC